MLMVTRSDSCIEFKLGDDSTIAIDVARLSGAMLAIERMPCGHVRHALVLTVAGGGDPFTIDGAPYELAELHGYVAETMRELGEAARRTIN